MITFPKTLSDAADDAAGHQVRAGGTDLQERRHLGIARGDLVDLRDVPGLDGLELDETHLHAGAGLTVAALGRDQRVRDGFPGLAAAAAALATPQIRARATLGGNLLQEVRCWYFRHPELTCLKQGGATCLARQGDHHFHSCFDNGPCVAPHPSTLAVALLAYDAQVELDDGTLLDISALLGDGSDPRRTHALPPGRLLRTVHVPLGEVGEQAAYGRAISRARAEWPLIEVVARLWLDEREGTVIDARVAMGGVANRPMLLTGVAEALLDQEPTDEVLAAAAAEATRGAEPLPMTAYKVAMIPGAVRDVLARARDVGLDSDPAGDGGSKATPHGLPRPPR